MLACFFMVLGQLPLRKIVPPNPRTNPNPSREWGGGGGGGGEDGTFPWGQWSGYLSSQL